MQNLRGLRESKKMTMKSLGNVIGVAESTISLYETGKREPDIATLILLANYFGVTVDYLVGHEKKPTVKDDGLTEMERLFLSLPPDRREEVLRFMEYQAAQSSAE